MANKRQRLARKRYKTEHPELFPKPDSQPPKDPKDRNEKKKLKATKGKFKKHGFQRFPSFSAENANLQCLRCRRRGHGVMDCPEVETDRVCYNCGKRGHSLSKCRKPIADGGAKFASCFVCNETGHLSRNCPKNPNGIYPKGGSCKICGLVTHLAKDCPEKGKKASSASNGVDDTAIDPEEMPVSQVVKLVSGDDLQDDFITDVKIVDKGKSSNSKDKKVTAKEKQCPKVVQFKGDDIKS